MKVKFDVDLLAHLKNIEIEAESFQKAKRKLLKMNIQDLLDESTIDDYFKVRDIDGRVEEYDITVEVHRITYKTDGIMKLLLSQRPEDDATLENLPHDLTLELKEVSGYQSDQELAIEQAIFEKTGFEVDHYKYAVIKSNYHME